MFYTAKSKIWPQSTRRSNFKKQRLVKQYSESPHFYNPYKKPEGRRFLFFVIMLPIIILGWVILLIFLPYFQIKYISFSGLNIIEQTEVENLIHPRIFSKKLGLPLNNFFLLSENKISKLITESLPVKSASVKKNFPNSLQVSITEKKPAIIYDNGEKYFLLDESGVAIKYLSNVESDEWTTTTKKNPEISSSTPTSSLMASNSTTTSTTTAINYAKNHEPNYVKIANLTGTNLPLLYDERGIEITNEVEIIPTNLIKNITALKNSLQKEGIGKVNYVQMSNPFTGLVLYLNKPWKLFIEISEDSSQNVDNQISSLKAILLENKPSQYVDLRYGDHVYWR